MIVLVGTDVNAVQALKLAEPPPAWACPGLLVVGTDVNAVQALKLGGVASPAELAAALVGTDVNAVQALKHACGPANADAAVAVGTDVNAVQALKPVQELARDFGWQGKVSEPT